MSVYSSDKEPTPFCRGLESLLLEWLIKPSGPVVEKSLHESEQLAWTLNKMLKEEIESRDFADYKVARRIREAIVFYEDDISVCKNQLRDYLDSFGFTVEFSSQLPPVQKSPDNSFIARVKRAFRG